jgi:hypothetical protein
MNLKINRKIFKMKIVVNRCFGGFSISEEAYERLIELGVPLIEDNEDIQEDSGEFVIIKIKEDAYGHPYYSDYIYNTENRHNPLLVQTVEELGEKANGIYAKLEVIDVPLNPGEYTIYEYNGIELVHENHRSW